MNGDYRDPYTFKGNGSVIFETGQWYPGEYPPGVIAVPGEYDRRCSYFMYDENGNLRVASQIPLECGGTGDSIENFIAREVIPEKSPDRGYDYWRSKLEGRDMQLTHEPQQALHDPWNYSMPWGDPADWGAYEIPDPPVSYVDDELGGLGSVGAIAIGAVVVLLGLGLALQK